MRSSTHARAGPSHVAAETASAKRTPMAIRKGEVSSRRSRSTWSSSSSSNPMTSPLLRRSSLRSSVAVSAASDDDKVPVPTRSEEDAETEPVLVLPRTMLLPEPDENFDDFGAPMVAPNSSSPNSSSSEPAPYPFSKFSLGDSEVSRWALNSNFSGKMAVLALAAMLVSERITGTGAVQALDLAVGVPLWEIEPALALVVGALLLAGLTPPREKPPPGTPPVPLNATIQAFMLRAAHLGLAAAIVSEVATGQGALDLFEFETGMGEISEVEAALVFGLLVFLTNPGKNDKSSRQGDGGE